MNINDKNEAWDYMVESGIATEQELQLITDINGWSFETMESVLYARTAYRSFDQLED